MRSRLLTVGLMVSLGSVACGRQAILSSDALPLKRVVIYRNGVGYFERQGLVDQPEVRFKMRESEVGDFLATLAVIEKGGSSVKAAAFPLTDDEADPTPREKMSNDERKGLKTVVLSLDGKEHDLAVGYIAESPVWKPSYRVVVGAGGQADLQVWGIVQNTSGEDWKDVSLTLVAGSPIAFDAQLGVPVVPVRPIVTDSGEVIAAVPKAETSLSSASAPPPPPSPSPSRSPQDDTLTADEDTPAAAAGFGSGRGRAASKPSKGSRADRVGGASGGPGAAAPARVKADRRYGAGAPSAPMNVEAVSAPAAEFERRELSRPRNLQSLAAVAQEGGTTRYELPQTVTIPDKSATMVMLLARSVPGESNFLFAPDGGVPASSSHPFRVARFANITGGMLEKGPIAVFEKGAFLGQGLLDPLPAAAIATVPFALERAIGVELERKYDERGERLAKVENGELTIERDGVTQTKYRIKNGGDLEAKVIVKHARISGTRLFQAPKDSEDNVGSGSALVPAKVAARATAELVVDERATLRRREDWFSAVADNAVKNYMGDARSPQANVSKLTTAWALRDQLVALRTARAKFASEQSNVSLQTEETRRNIVAIEKNKSADALRAKLTQRLGEMATRLDEISRHMVETDLKSAELEVRFKESLRELVIVETPAPKP